MLRLVHRRDFVSRCAALAASPALVALPAAAPAPSADWARVREDYDDGGIANFNHANVGMMARPVAARYHERIGLDNAAPPLGLKQEELPRVEDVRKAVAAFLGSDAEETAIVRNATEALETVLFGVPLKPGDEILHTSHEFPRMLAACRQRAAREGIVMRAVATPPAMDDQAVVDAIAGAVGPNTRLLLVNLLTHTTGRTLPVASIVAAVRGRGVQVVVDAAQAAGHVPVSFAALGCDYLGVSLHKWVNAPHGTGALVMRRERIADVWPLFAPADPRAANIRKFEDIGTRPAAAYNGILDALAYQNALGPDRKMTRLADLGREVAAALRRIDGLTILPNFAGAIFAARLTSADPDKVAERLKKESRLLIGTVHHADVNGLRISPGLNIDSRDIDRLADRLRAAL